MIPDSQTNFVYFSSLLRDSPNYQPFWDRLKAILDDEAIQYGFIDGTRDIWCRDYVAVQVSKDKFIQFTYFPDYYLHPKWIKFLTIQEEVVLDFQHEVKKSNLIIDGGNVVKNSDTAILTEKVFTDNRNYSRKRIEKELYSLLEVDNIFFIPVLPFDETGHSDGMVRLMDDGRLLVNDFSKQSKSWRSKFDKAIDRIGREVVIIPYVESENEKNFYSARGCYINFMQVGSTIIIPTFGFGEDEIVLEQFQRLFASSKVLTIPASEIAADGGVLNCISWNLCKGL